MTKTAQGILLSTVLATITACGSTKPANTGTGGRGGAGGTSSIAGSSGTAGSTATAGTMGSAGADAGTGTTGAAGSDAGSDAANDVPAQTDGGTTTTNIKAATGGTVTAAGLTVVIPAGALAADTDITVAVSDGVGLPGAATLVAKVYDLGPTGTNFLKPVGLAIDFDTAKVAAPKVATVAFLQTGAWVRLADSSTNGTKASATTTHFTPFSVVNADPLTTDAGATPDSADAAPVVQCGTAPYSPFAASIIAGGGATLPPSAHLRSNICGAGTFLDIPLSPGGTFQGQGTIYLQNTPQFLTATASDDSAYPFLTQEFTSLTNAQVPLLTGLPFTLSAKTSAFHPPGYGPGVGNAYILIQLNKSSAAAPCNDDDGITISVVGSTHPEAIVYYVTSTTAYSTTGPSVKGKENVSIILKPSSALEYVQIMGTKPSCSVDTGITATSNVRKVGFTGLIPIAPDSTTFAQASVAAP
jgi:hypothetical protein